MTSTQRATRWLVAAAVLLCTTVAVAQDDSEPWTAPDDAKAVANPLTASDEALATGGASFRKLCKSCHGEKGLGDGPAARFLDKSPRDLTDAARMGAMSDGELFWKIRTGRPPMLSFESKLSEEETWAVVLFLRTLSSEATSN